VQVCFGWTCMLASLFWMDLQMYVFIVLCSMCLVLSAEKCVSGVRWLYFEVVEKEKWLLFELNVIPSLNG